MTETLATSDRPADREGHPHRWLLLAAMVFAVSMVFIDMTIVSIAIPEVQKELGLSQTGIQWVINGYLLATAAFIAFGGRLGDIFGHAKMVVVGIVIFAIGSGMSGATPADSAAEAWIIGFRVLQGIGGAIMFPAALTLVINSFPLSQRGKATALFFGITGAMTAVGPVAGGYLTEWTWRAIFWVNLPVAVIALVLTAIARPTDETKRDRLDFRGLLFIATGMGLLVLGLQQATDWGWSSPATLGCIAVGALLLVVFVLVELRTSSPLIDMVIFKNRNFAADNAVLFLTFAVFIPLMFFASTYAQISLGWSSSNAGTYLLIIFAGFMVAAQIGGRMLDRRGVRPPVVLGCALATAGLAWWASQLPGLSVGSQWPGMVLAGAGLGMVIGQANTDAVSHAPRLGRGEATGVTQTTRNFGSSLGLAVLGTILITVNTAKIENQLEAAGESASRAEEVATALSKSAGGDESQFPSLDSKEAEELAKDSADDFAEAQEVVLYTAAGFMGLAFVVAVITLPRGRQKQESETEIAAAGP